MSIDRGNSEKVFTKLRKWHKKKRILKYGYPRGTLLSEPCDEKGGEFPGVAGGEGT